MTHEQFIKPETAKLAKLAGFDWEVETYYNASGKAGRGMSRNWNEDTGTFYDTSRPTQAVLQRWLREVKNIIVLVDYNEDDDCEENERYGVTVYIGNKRIVELATYPTYEEALEAGLQKYLTKIIENR